MYKRCTFYSSKNKCTVLRAVQSQKALWPGIASNSSMCSITFLLLPLRLLWSLHALWSFCIFFISYFIWIGLRSWPLSAISLLIRLYVLGLVRIHQSTSVYRLYPQMAGSITVSPGIQLDLGLCHFYWTTFDLFFLVSILQTAHLWANTGVV